MATHTADLTRTGAQRRGTVRQWRRLHEMSLGYLLLAPAFLLLLVFEFYPVFYGLYISMCDWRLSCTRFVGFDNFLKAFNDQEMWFSLWNTAVYAAISVPLQLSLGLFLAYLLFQNIRGRDAFRVMFFFPYITSTVASAAVWAYLYSPDRGLINAVMKGFGLPQLRWLG
ncbi:MAG: sugar ABC transporter permease, partial [Chloroflexi bacterium]|nr:sugar ABC transporter permease [Chloroflexota bacterium]